MRRAIIILLLLTLLFGCSKEPVQQLPAQAPEVSLPNNPFEPIVERDEELSDLSEYRRINIRMFRYGFDPETITIKKDEKIMLTVTSVDVGHGFALPDFGINVKVPPEESVTVKFTADITGEFEFFESTYSGPGWKDMKGTLVVQAPSEQSE